MLNGNSGGFLIGKLRIMASDATNAVYRQYITRAVDFIESDESGNRDMLAEVIAALEMMSYQYNRREAEALRDAAAYLNALYAREMN